VAPEISPKPLDSTWCQSRSRRCGGDSSQRVEPSGTRRRGLGTGEARHRPGRGWKARRGSKQRRGAGAAAGGGAASGRGAAPEQSSRQRFRLVVRLLKGVV